MDSAPGIPTFVEGIGFNQYHQDTDLEKDPYTATLNATLNAWETVATVPIQRPANRMADPEVPYTTQWTEPPVDNQVSVLLTHYDAPNVPVSPTSFKQSFFNTTLAQQQVSGPIPLNLRSPGINEGY